MRRITLISQVSLLPEKMKEAGVICHGNVGTEIRETCPREQVAEDDAYNSQFRNRKTLRRESQQSESGNVL